MKTYKSRDLTHKRAEVMREAEKNGVIIQECRTNGDVRQEFVVMTREMAFSLVDNNTMADGKCGNTKELQLWNWLQPNNCSCGKDECIHCSYDW